MMLHGEVRLVEIFILIAVHMDVLTYQQDLLEAYIHKFMLIYQSLFIDKKRDCISNLFSIHYFTTTFCACGPRSVSTTS